LRGWIGSACAGRARDLTAGKLTPNLSHRIADVHGRQWSTQTSPSRFSQRATGPPRNLTFADTVEKVRDVDSGHSQVATTDTHGIPAERLHPKARQ
jgi:hypothetical protein